MRTLDAFEVARKAAGKTDPIVTDYLHSSVIVTTKGKIISVGRNHFSGRIISTDEGDINKTVHSEVHALMSVNIRRLEGASIVNYARTNVSSILARPCANCYRVLSKLGFRKVFYTVRSDLRQPLWMEEYF